MSLGGKMQKRRGSPDSGGLPGTGNGVGGYGAAASRQRQLTGSILRDELPAVVLLVILYMLQGVPLGLCMGSMPFLMQAKMSYTKIGIFSLASYPYSFKLLWSPIVDSIYWPAVGRRRSWILPLQTTSAALMLAAAGWVESQLEAGNAGGVTSLFFLLVLLAATQDVAVDGWALSLLSKKNVGYAATCQTVGMNLGYFTSFTVFLALNDAAFCAKWLGANGSTGVVSLSGYLRFWGWAYLAITAGVALLTKERNHGGSNGGGSNGKPGARRRSARLQSAASASLADAEGGATHYTPGFDTRESTTGLPHLSLAPSEAKSGAGAGPGSGAGSGSGAGAGSLEYADEQPLPLREAYLQLWRVVRLPAVQLLALLLVTCRLGMLPAEAAAPLKLLEKGVSKEALAGLVLAEFPMELVSAVVAGRWAASAHPFKPWLTAYHTRLALAALSTYAVYRFPLGAAAISDAPSSFAAIALLGVATSFTSTLMFTALGSFFNRISDPSMGGAYLTLLNTVANIGVIVPKLFIFAAMDWLTVKQCVGASSHVPSAACSAAASKAAGSGADNACTAAGGSCEVVRDGFYLLSGMAVCLGLLVLALLRRVLPRLETTPLEAWHARANKQH